MNPKAVFHQKMLITIIPLIKQMKKVYTNNSWITNLDRNVKVYDEPQYKDSCQNKLEGDQISTLSEVLKR